MSDERCHFAHDLFRLIAKRRVAAFLQLDQLAWPAHPPLDFFELLHRAVFVVGPLMALLAVAVSIMVSSKVNDPRVAEQISMVVLIPILAVFFGQLAGMFVINRQLILISAVVLALVDAVAVYLAVRLFQRETILTRWK